MDHTPAPDAELVARASRSVGLRVALACAVLVVVGASVFFGYLWWHVLHPEITPSDAATTVTVDLDLVDLATAALLAGTAAVLTTGFASVWFARSATRPLADALRRQREFVSNASHELRTPLTVLSARVQLLQARGGTDPALRPLTDDLRRDIDSLADIVSDMLSLARLDQAPEGTCDAGAVAARTCEGLALGVARDRDVELRSEVPSVGVAVPGETLGRMVLALVDNALSFAPAGTEVTVTGEATGDVVRLRVRDRGPGIRGVAPDHVFDRFARGRPATTTAGAVPRASHGIGLALVRETARRHRGDAVVESTGPEGTVMALVLPAARGASGEGRA